MHHLGFMAGQDLETGNDRNLGRMGTVADLWNATRSGKFRSDTARIGSLCPTFKMKCSQPASSRVGGLSK